MCLNNITMFKKKKQQKQKAMNTLLISKQNTKIAKKQNIKKNNVISYRFRNNL